jgi:DNA-binding GntR family transcriptional regulator
MILSSEIKPGSWLRQQDVAASFQVSRTPVREAMRTLAQEGLVETVPHYGARVTRLTMEEFEELYALRSGIEGLAARLAAQQVTAGQIPPLRQALDQLAALTHTVELPVYLRQEWRFRLQCYQVTGRQRLLNQVVFLREHSERYIHLAYGLQARIDESFGFHVQLMEAIAAGDGNGAERVLQSALQWTLRNAGPVVATLIGQ